MTRTLPQWLQFIEALHPFEIELGLERVSEVYALFPPAQVPRVISVAGTNGKGSTVECLTQCAIAMGSTVGTYTSPHLVRFSERMCVNGKPASDAQIVAAFETVEEARGVIPLTYFEFTTLAALALFRSLELDLWVLEVGLGGRLDAVNIIDSDVAVVTTIGLDHQDWLGDDREAIGREKAGIMRTGRLAVCSDPNPPAQIGAYASQIGTHLLQLGQHYNHSADATSWSYSCQSMSADGSVDSGIAVAVGELSRVGLPRPAGAVLDNLAGALTALAALDLLPSEQRLIDVLSNWSLRGRLQRVELGATWWLDVAHNTESAALLATTLASSMSVEGLTECHVVLGMLRDKPVDEVIEALSPLVTHWLVVGLDSPRALPANELATKVQRVSAARVEVFESVAAGVAVARARAGQHACVVVTGSFHTVGPALAWLSR